MFKTSSTPSNAYWEIETVKAIFRACELNMTIGYCMSTPRFREM